MCLRFDFHDIALLIRQNTKFPEKPLAVATETTLVFETKTVSFILSILFKSNGAATLKRCGFHKKTDTKHFTLYTFTFTYIFFYGFLKTIILFVHVMCDHSRSHSVCHVPDTFETDTC